MLSALNGSAGSNPVVCADVFSTGLPFDAVGSWPLWGYGAEPDFSGNGSLGIVTGTTRVAHPNAIADTDAYSKHSLLAEIARGWCRN